MSLLCPKEKLFTLVETEEDKFIEEQIDEELIDSKMFLFMKINV